MPFLRVIRDKRGYETTYLMHWFREGSRQRSRILYIFRTPGGVRVGRDALAPDIQREIEARHPDIQFDWKAVLENQQLVEPAPDQRRTRKARRPEERDDGAEKPEAPVPAAPGARFTVPSSIDGSTPDEQIAFLGHWYTAIRDQIPIRTPDPERQQVLLSLAERLNPAAWVDADQITSGFGDAAQALERLSRIFAKRRRRGRKAAAGTHAAAQPATSGSTDTAIGQSADVDAAAGDEDGDATDVTLDDSESPD